MIVSLEEAQALLRITSRLRLFRNLFLAETILGATGLLFSGCAVSQAPRAVCPVIVPYSLADDRALEAALQAHPSPIVSRYLRDYAGLRDQARACAQP